MTAVHFVCGEGRSLNDLDKAGRNLERTAGERDVPTVSVDRSAEAIERLPDGVDRLSISHHNPEGFFEERSEIVFALRE